MSAKILPVKTILTLIFPGTKYVDKVEKKVGKTAFQNVKDLTNRNSNITKFGSTHNEESCETNVLEN